MFTDTDSFYYSLTGDITNSIQRQYSQTKESSDGVLPLWKKIDDRFFFNRHMLSDLISLEVNNISYFNAKLKLFFCSTFFLTDWSNIFVSQLKFLFFAE